MIRRIDVRANNVANAESPHTLEYALLACERLNDDLLDKTDRILLHDEGACPNPQEICP